MRISVTRSYRVATGWSLRDSWHFEFLGLMGPSRAHCREVIQCRVFRVAKMGVTEYRLVSIVSVLSILAIVIHSVWNPNDEHDDGFVCNRPHSSAFFNQRSTSSSRAISFQLEHGHLQCLDAAILRQLSAAAAIRKLG